MSRKSGGEAERYRIFPPLDMRECRPSISATQRNQSDATLQYAVRYGFEIVQTYSDERRPGCGLDGRDALKQLLHDTESGDAGFKAILLYDVSLWTLPAIKRPKTLGHSPKARL